MISEYTKSLVEARKYYFSIGSIPCPILSGTPIYFNRRGFRHFLRKKKGLRPIDDQIRRFGLLKYIPEIISSKQSTARYTKGNKFVFCEISKEVDKNYFIKIVTIKASNGNLCFFSIIDFYKQK
ncbi:MAG: hypothetical protein AAB917_03055 [Patescibacteria group bacterium]